jgi:PTH1 family peptidyl-tRNA hydrolase
MKLIVGLGNPGKEYEWTRHNIGFGLLEVIANYKNVSFSKEKFNASYAEVDVNGERVLLIKPLSFMNLSGGVVRKFYDFYKLSLDDILVIQDDLDMDFGRIKVVFNSSSGGHNGIKDIERCLGSKEYTRLKIGISNDKLRDTKDYVLGSFSKEEREKLGIIYENLVNLVDDFCNLSLDRIMNKYNRK